MGRLAKLEPALQQTFVNELRLESSHARRQDCVHRLLNGLEPIARLVVSGLALGLLYLYPQQPWWHVSPLLYMIASLVGKPGMAQHLLTLFRKPPTRPRPLSRPTQDLKPVCECRYRLANQQRCTPPCSNRRPTPSGETGPEGPYAPSLPPATHHPSTQQEN